LGEPVLDPGGDGAIAELLVEAESARRAVRVDAKTRALETGRLPFTMRATLRAAGPERVDQSLA
jgi:hypothetical protein